MSRIITVDVGIHNTAIAAFDCPHNIPGPAPVPQSHPARKYTKEEAVRKAMEILSEPPVVVFRDTPSRHNNDLEDAYELFKAHEAGKEAK